MHFPAFPLHFPAHFPHLSTQVNAPQARDDGARRVQPNFIIVFVMASAF